MNDTRLGEPLPEFHCGSEGTKLFGSKKFCVSYDEMMVIPSFQIVAAFNVRGTYGDWMKMDFTLELVTVIELEVLSGARTSIFPENCGELRRLRVSVIGTRE